MTQNNMDDVAVYFFMESGEDCDEEVINLCREWLHIEITPTMIVWHVIADKINPMDR